MNIRPESVAAMGFRDPVLNRRLTDAVTIVPCSCKVNKEVVANINFTVQGKFFTAPAGTCCAVCKEPMMGVIEDTKMSKLVNDFYLSVGKSGLILDQIPAETPKPWVGPPPSYPEGVREKMKLDTRIAKHNPNNVGGLFRSETLDSPLQMLSVHLDQKYRKVSIQFKQGIGFEEYLRGNGFILSEHDLHNGYCSTVEPVEMRKLFELIVANNNFDANEVVRIRNELNSTSVRKPQPIHYML